jgi:hypothetical protein
VNRQPSLFVVAVGSLVLAAVAGLGVAALWSDRAASAPEVATSPGARSSSPSATKAAPAIVLRGDESQAASGQRIQLTGTAPAPGLALVVQQRVNGMWVPFPATGTTRSDGSFASYVIFARPGEHVLRMVARGGPVSNAVTVTIS